MTISFYSPLHARQRDLRSNFFTGAFDDLLHGFVARPAAASAPAAATARGFKFDVRETGNTYVVEADLPGLSKDAIKIEIDGAQVSISAQYAAATSATSATAATSGKSATADAVGAAGNSSAAGTPGEAGQARLIYRERSAGAVARSFELPAEIDQEAASAKYEDGVLRLTLPKKIAETRKLLAIH